MNLQLLRRIDEQFLETPFYGSRQMTRWLLRQGTRVSRKRVRRLMRLLGLQAIFQRSRTSEPLCLPEISSAACTLRIWRRPGSLRGHGNRVFRAVHRARVGPAEPGGASDRERRAAPSIGGLAATGSRATAVAASRPAVLDVAVSPVARLAARARHRQARHGPPLASTRLSALLALEESAAWARAAPHPARRSRTHPPDVRCLRRSLLIRPPLAVRTTMRAAATRPRQFRRPPQTRADGQAAL